MRGSFSFSDKPSRKFCAANFLISSAAPRLGAEFETKLFFNPTEFTTSSTRKTRGFLKYVLRARKALSSFCVSGTALRGLSFFNIKRSTLKFRKRSNMYFSLCYVSRPGAQAQFLLTAPQFIKFINTVCARLFNVHGLRAGISKIKLVNDSVHIYILNPHFIDAFLMDRPLKKEDLLVVRLILTSSTQISRSLVRAVYCPKSEDDQEDR